MRYFAAFVFRDADSLSFTCPDVPGFTAQVSTLDLDDAIGEARAVLAGHVAVLTDMGADPIVSRDVAALRADPELADDFAQAECVVMIPALMPTGRSVRVNLSMDEAMLAAIDRSAKERKITRSAFVIEASRRLIEV